MIRSTGAGRSITAPVTLSRVAGPSITTPITLLWSHSLSIAVSPGRLLKAPGTVRNERHISSN